jgi:hypothetical protein
VKCKKEDVMFNLKTALLIGAMSIATLGTQAHAVVVTVETGVTNGSGFSTLPSATPFIGDVASASFIYSGPINFSNAAAQNSGPSGDLNSTFFGSNASFITSYSGSGTVPGLANFSTLTSFLASSGSASSFGYGSLYSFDLGVLPVQTILTITHDDGVSVFQNGNQVGPTVSGPTSAVTDVVTLTATADTVLWYSRQNGTPSILQVTTNVPEPATLSVLGVAIVALRACRSRRKRA